MSTVAAIVNSKPTRFMLSKTDKAGYRGRPIAATIVGAMLSYLAAGSVLSAVDTHQDMSPLAVVDTQDVEAYRDVVARIEGESGAYASELTENLLSLGLALQQQNRHTEAVDIFKRGTHIARISDGLYSATQIPLIQGEITSHIAQGNLLEADQRQQYMYKVQRRSLSSPESLTMALLQQAKWQRSAYELGVGEQPYSRLINMWDLYRGAITQIASVNGDTSAKLLSPLHGLLQTQYLISGHQLSEGASTSGSGTTFSAQQDLNRFNAYRARSYKQGHAVIRAIYDIENAQTDDQYLAAAEALVMLGDWNLWHGAKVPAAEAYNSALTELVELEDSEFQIERIFGVPVALPAVEGVQTLPPLVSPEEADIVLEFSVTERGRVLDLTRVDEPKENEGSVNRLMRKLRATRFRPRFEGLQPVNTEKVIHAYKFPR
jgi:hypothetical protein